MAVDSRRKARLKREKEKLYKLLIDFMESEEYNNDPIWQRAIEIGRSRHLPLTEAMKLAEQEFENR